MNQTNHRPSHIPLDIHSAPNAMHPRHTYANDRPYRAPVSAFCVNSSPFLQPPLTATFALTTYIDWPGFWVMIQTALRNKAFQRGTLRTYRQVLRTFRSYIVSTASHRSKLNVSLSPSGFRSHVADIASQATADPSSRSPSLHQSEITLPSSVTPNHIKAFINHLVDKQVSWSWQSTCVAVLRTTFDKLAGLSVTAGLVTPKRPLRLGDIVSSDDVARMIEALPTVRDRLIVGLLYGCGMKVGELSRLRWQDVNVDSRQLTIHFAGLTRSRRISIPETLMPLLATGVRQCPAGDFIFQGTRKDKPLSDRMIERIVRRAALSAGLFKEVCCMTLRHSYAVAMLRQGSNPRQLQENLGHQSIKTTLNYQRYILPKDVLSPADRLTVSKTEKANHLASKNASDVDPASSSCSGVADRRPEPDVGADPLISDSPSPCRCVAGRRPPPLCSNPPPLSPYPTPSSVLSPPSTVNRPPSTVNSPPSSVFSPPSSVLCQLSLCDLCVLRERHLHRPPSSVNRPPSTVSSPPSSTPPLNIKPGALDPVELPFPLISNGAQEFYALLKTCIRNRFLAIRAAAKYPNEAGP